MGRLSLTRKSGESIVITDANGTEIVIYFVDLRRHQVRVSVEAPPEYVIDRRGGQNEQQ